MFVRVSHSRVNPAHEGKFPGSQYRHAATEERVAILGTNSHKISGAKEPRRRSLGLVNDRVSWWVSVLAVEQIREYLSIGVMQAPHQTLAVQVLRNTRCVEEIAHGPSIPIGPSRSPNPTKCAASG